MTSALSLIADDYNGLLEAVRNIKTRISSFQSLPTPCYLYDGSEVSKRYGRLVAAFRASGMNPKIFYALKSNPYPGLLQTLKKLGAGFDVSSVHEFMLARNAGASEFVFTGPGKTEEDIRFIASEARKGLIVHLESLQELRNAAAAAASLGRTIQCGVRVVPETHAAWGKFGIPLRSLRQFLKAASAHPNIDLRGIQFHMSYVKSGATYRAALEEVARYLSVHVSRAMFERFSFIDIGGGFYPDAPEGEYPWNEKGVLLFDRPGLVSSILKRPFRKRAKKIAVQPIEEVAGAVAEVFSRKISPLFDGALFIEPGRYLSQPSMHMVMRVVDKKNAQSIIVNGGWNMVGWEKFQYLYYAPIFNLTSWAPRTERPCLVYGNLCIPDDIWGYYVHGGRCAVGDLLLVPFQGAYTFAYRQEFIRGIPPVMHL